MPNSNFRLTDTVAILVGIAVLVFGICSLAVLTKVGDKINNSTTQPTPTNATTFDDQKAVKTSDYQAVFLKDGKAYFGKITTIDQQYIELSDIFYLNANGQNGQPSFDKNASLVKLGCELHGPRDVMYILKDDTSFWENLKPDGQVSKAIQNYKTQNPNGQTCTSS